MNRLHAIRQWLRLHPRVAGAVVAGCLVALVYARRTTSREGAGAPAQRPATVVAQPARAGDIGVYLDGIGTVTARATVTVHTRVDGQLMAVHFREGQTVASGDLLAEIDPRPFQVQLAQAEGQLARDQALLANAKVDLQRYRQLFADDSIAKQQLDTQQSLVRQFEAALEIDQSQIDSARLNLTYSRITAPVGGRIGLRLVDVGNIVRTTDTSGLAVVTELQPIDVVFTVPEDELPPLMAKVRGGAPIAVEAYDREGTRRLATGRLLSVDNAIDPSTGTVRVKAEFPNADDALFPNQFVNARLELEVRQGATLVPDTAVQRGTRGTFVYVVKDDHTADVRPVTVGVTEGGETSIDAGLTPGELVVVDGADLLRPGSPVLLATRP